MILLRWLSGRTLGAVLAGCFVAACGNEPAAPQPAAPQPAGDSPVDKSAPAPTGTATPKAANADSTADTASAYGVHSFCPQICERTRTLGCRAAERCDAMCRNAFSDMVCPDTLRPAMDCALSQPIAEWTCSEDGVAAVKDGPCDTQQLAYDKCLTAIK